VQSPKSIARIVDLAVSWDGSDGSIPLAQFRSRFVKVADPAHVEITKLTPARGRGSGFWVAVSRDELVAEVLLAIERYVERNELTSAIEERVQRRAATAGLDEDRWNEAIAQLRAIPAELGRHPAGSSGHRQLSDRARVLLASLDELLGPNRPATGTAGNERLQSHPLAVIVALVVLAPSFLSPAGAVAVMVLGAVGGIAVLVSTLGAAFTDHAGLTQAQLRGVVRGVVRGCAARGCGCAGATVRRRVVLDGAAGCRAGRRRAGGARRRRRRRSPAGVILGAHAPTGGDTDLPGGGFTSRPFDPTRPGPAPAVARRRDQPCHRIGRDGHRWQGRGQMGEAGPAQSSHHPPAGAAGRGH
jgi:hypothetical protein